MSKKALIIFLKYPELGRSKTRLAASIGDEKALAVYKQLLEHTHQIAEKVNADKYLYYDKVSTNKMPWNEDVFYTAYQTESDLGGRMKNAFDELFSKGYQQIVIIGSDCYELTTEIIESAFDQLNKKEVVIGPAKDGGYYLLGLTRMIPPLFSGITWSTNEVYQRSLEILKANQIEFGTTPVLSDIDVIEDLPEELKKIIHFSSASS